MLVARCFVCCMLRDVVCCLFGRCALCVVCCLLLGVCCLLMGACRLLCCLLLVGC